MSEEVGHSSESQKPEAIDLSKTAEIAEATKTGQAKTPSADELQLERFGTDLVDVEDEEMDDDDDDDEQDHIAQHPLLGMLAGRFGQTRRRGSSHKYDSLHPVTSVLGLANVDDCFELEQAFPENERASREKFEYRLSKCPELSLGIFTQPTESEVSNGKSADKKLIAMIISTRTSAPAVTDGSMDFPKDWRTKKSVSTDPAPDEVIGHQDVGRTIALHSLAVASEHQGKGLASVLMKSYIQRIKDSKIADRIALLAHQELVPFYQRFNFEDMGLSSSKHGGESWNNMVLEFSQLYEE